MHLSMLPPEAGGLTPGIRMFWNFGILFPSHESQIYVKIPMDVP